MAFKGKSENGKLIIYDTSKLRHFLLQLDKEELRIDIEKWFEKRSDNQNRYYFGVVVKILADYTGHTPDEIHEALKSKFITKRIVLDEKIVIGSSKLTTSEFEEFMSRIRAFASTDLNCYIPEPNEAPTGYAYNPNDYNEKGKQNKETTKKNSTELPKMWT